MGGAKLMIEKPATDLNLVRPNDPLPTVEVDLDSIPEELFGYGDLVAQNIQPFAASSSELRATIYVYQGPSVNFHENTFSAFFGVAGQKKQELLDLLLHSFRRVSGVKARCSDYIDASMGLSEFHIENGVVWRPLDAVTWYAETQHLNNDEKDEGEKIVYDQEHIHIEKKRRNSSPVRFRAARSDTTVGVIRTKIEEIFGLPEGSVALCDPDGNHMRSDARIGTLRNRWDY
jgi:hypothetical protein